MPALASDLLPAHHLIAGWGADFDPRKVFPIPLPKTRPAEVQPDAPQSQAFLPTTGDGLVAVAIAVAGWLLWSFARRTGHADMIHRRDLDDHQTRTQGLIDAYERRCEKLEAQNASLVKSLLDQSDTRHINAELQTKLAQMGAQKEAAQREALALRRQNDDLLVLLKQSNGGFSPTEINPTPMPAYV